MAALLAASTVEGAGCNALDTTKPDRIIFKFVVVS
jgi:hypothetical protein